MHWPSLGGYILLVLLALLAPTPAPVPLDGIIIGLIAQGYNPALVLLVAGISDLVGTFLIFKIGSGGRKLISKYRRKHNRKDYVLAENLFKKYGKYSLLLGGIPFLGDALIFISGFYQLGLSEFFIWFLTGKAIWYGLFAISLIALGHPLFPL